ncbi:MAG: polysaccharide deacetylase family protein [Solirubrobacteraceae bacterium]
MSSGEGDWRRQRREQRRRQVARRRQRAIAIGAIAVVIVVVVAVVASSGGGSKGARGSSGAGTPVSSTVRAHEHARGRTRRHARRSSSPPSSVAEEAKALAATVARDPAASALATPSASVTAPILMYHVINPPPPGAPFPGLYVPKEEFAQQMHALYNAGFYGVTLEELWQHWHSGLPLPKGKPVVLSFDNGYQSQFSNALPVLRHYGWKAIENMQLSGLPPSQGGLSQAQLHGLIDAGWELDTQGYSHAELPALTPAELHFQVVQARKTVQRRYHVPVNWFCYPSGHYNARVIAAVEEAGFKGSTTVIPGWANATESPYRLPRLRVLGGTSGEGLISLVEGTQTEPTPPSVYE